MDAPQNTWLRHQSEEYRRSSCCAHSCCRCCIRCVARKEAHRRVLWLAEDDCVTPQGAASRNVESGLDVYLRLCGLQPGAHAKLDGRSGVVSPGRSVCAPP